jgi:hypothetical protein
MDLERIMEHDGIEHIKLDENHGMRMENDWALVERHTFRLAGVAAVADLMHATDGRVILRLQAGEGTSELEGIEPGMYELVPA